MNMAGELKACYFNKYCMYACLLIQKIALLLKQILKTEIVSPFAAALNIAV